MWRQRTVIPSSLGQPNLSELHDCTHEVNSVQSIWQSGIDQNIERLARECQPCLNTSEFSSANIIKTKDNPMCFLSPKVLTLFISNYLSDLQDFPNFKSTPTLRYSRSVTKWDKRLSCSLGDLALSDECSLYCFFLHCCCRFSFNERKSAFNFYNFILARN